jgi:hypothetical protein
VLEAAIEPASGRTLNRHRALLALRTIDVSYRSALRHAPTGGPRQHEWLGSARQRAEQALNLLESQLHSAGPHDPEVLLQFRIVRENVRRADDGARAADTTPIEAGDPKSGDIAS